MTDKEQMSRGEALARVAVLEAESADHERLQAEAERLQAARAADKARIAELEAALSPFAHAAGRFKPRNRKLADARRDQATLWSACDGEYAITVQDLRTAEAALAQQGKDGET